MGKVGYRFSGITAEHKIWIGGDRLDIDSQGIQLNTSSRIESKRQVGFRLSGFIAEHKLQDRRLDIDSQGLKLSTKFKIRENWLDFIDSQGLQLNTKFRIGENRLDYIDSQGRLNTIQPLLDQERELFIFGRFPALLVVGGRNPEKIIQQTNISSIRIIAGVFIIIIIIIIIQLLQIFAKIPFGS